MQLIELLSPELTFCNLDAKSKKNLIGQIAKLFSQQIPEIDSDPLFDELIAREKLGSTGVGDGICIPHCRVDLCKQPLGALIKLKDSIDYDATDNKRVDLVFVLLVPKESTDEHLQLLGQIAELLNQPSTRQALRATQSNNALYEAARNIMLNQAESHAT